MQTDMDTEVCVDVLYWHMALMSFLDGVRDVLAATDDEVLFPIDDEDEPLLVELGYIARSQPPRAIPFGFQSLKRSWAQCTQPCAVALEC